MAEATTVAWVAAAETALEAAMAGAGEGAIVEAGVELELMEMGTVVVALEGEPEAVGEEAEEMAVAPVEGTGMEATVAAAEEVATAAVAGATAGELAKAAAMEVVMERAAQSTPPAPRCQSSLWPASEVRM